MGGDKVVLYRAEEGIGRITLERPEALDALNRDVLARLASVPDEADVDQEVGAVVITGTGERAFSAGADVRHLNRATPLEVRDFARLAVGVTGRIETLGKPVATINGDDAFGGSLGLAEACALRVAVRGARLGHPEVRIGAVAGFGGTTRLPRLIGKAAEPLLTGRPMGAEEALRVGLLNGITEPETLLEEPEALVREILSRSPVAVGLRCEAVHRGLGMTEEESAFR